ncbi:MAG: TGS domain-containing protein, partial [Halobacteriaceae archaeon]
MSENPQRQVEVTLPDGSTLAVERGATVGDVAYEIGPGLGEDAVAGVLDGDIVALEEPVADGATVEIVTEDSGRYLQVLRHTAAHVFAQALQRLYPDAKLAIGPPTDEGFYYDVAGVDLDADDLERIEDEMGEIVRADYPLERVERSREDALALYGGESEADAEAAGADAEDVVAEDPAAEPTDNRFKREILAEEAADAETVTFYRQDGWEDLCRGPHVASTGEVGAFELLSVSTAYWRGDEDNEMLTRVEGTAFETEAALEEFLEQRAEARRRDHRKIGSEMDLFSIPDVTGPGLPLYHPNGKAVLRELEDYVDDLNAGEYDQVETPHVFRTELWERSGHYENYRDDMFLLDVNDEEYGLKPM